jgi:dTDP-4-amino-4,6-dideoxy-D-galactose acyltransferase
MPEVIQLDWDSNFFGIKTGKCILTNDTLGQLESTLSQAKENGYGLIYLFTPGDMLLPESLLVRLNGKLVDHKVTFFCNNLNIIDTVKTNTVEEYLDTHPEESLIELALISGQYSRFRVDDNFMPGKFEQLYKTWISRSVSKDVADTVYIVRIQNNISGMMTVKWDTSKAIIGLVGVLKEAQGNSLGTLLVNKLKEESQKRGIQQIEVASQKENDGACRFYIKNGFNEISLKKVYHFWLR